MNVQRLTSKLLTWRLRHVSDRNFVLILSGIIGIVAGIAAVSLKTSVHAISHFLTHLSGERTLLYVMLPVVGLLLTYLVATFFFQEKLGHGVSTVLWYISRGGSQMKRRMMMSRMFTSAITVGFGGSVGLEAPIVVTGSAIGSNIGAEMHLNAKKRSLLIGCGAAGAVSAIFNSPIAGVIFAIEVILSEVNINKFVPLLIASVFGSLVSQLFGLDELLFSFPIFNKTDIDEVPFYVGLGVFSGLVALYVTRAHYYVEGLIGKVANPFQRIAIGGVLLGAIIMVFPQIFGEGYTTIISLVDGTGMDLLDNTFFSGVFSGIAEHWFLVAFVAGLILIKAVASALTIGSGGSGGIFAPSLFIGGLSGFMFAKVANLLGADLPVAHFVLVGMAGVMSGVLHAPLTGIFLIAEITGGYTLFVPLMLVSALAYMTIYYFEPYSLYTKHLVESGDLLTGNKDRQVLCMMDMKKLIEKDFKIIHPDSSLGELTEVVKNSARNIYPVVDSNCTLVGVVNLNDIRQIMFDHDKQLMVVVKTIMQIPRTTISMRDDMETVMAKFETSKSWNLPVIREDGTYVGFHSKSKIFNSYRSRLMEEAKED